MTTRNSFVKKPSKCLIILSKFTRFSVFFLSCVLCADVDHTKARAKNSRSVFLGQFELKRVKVTCKKLSHFYKRKFSLFFDNHGLLLEAFLEVDLYFWSFDSVFL